MFDLINNSEINTKSYNYIFSLCDSVSFLYVDYSNSINLEQAILESKYQELTNEILTSKYDTDNWNMSGLIYFFKPTQYITNLIKQNSLQSAIELTKSCRLENLTLYKNNKVLYSICTHEGYEYIDDEFKNLVSNFCLNEIKKTDKYKELLSKIECLNCEKPELAKSIAILYDLSAYINQDNQAPIYITPKYECNFNNYLNLVKQYLSNNLFEQFNKYNSFKEISTTNYPNNLEDLNLIKSFTYTPNESLDIYKNLTEDLNVFNTILIEKFGNIDFINQIINGSPTFFVRS